MSEATKLIYGINKFDDRWCCVATVRELMEGKGFRIILKSELDKMTNHEPPNPQRQS